MLVFSYPFEVIKCTSKERCGLSGHWKAVPWDCLHQLDCKSQCRTETIKELPKLIQNVHYGQTMHWLKTLFTKIDIVKIWLSVNIFKYTRTKALAKGPGWFASAHDGGHGSSCMHCGMTANGYLVGNVTRVVPIFPHNVACPWNPLRGTHCCQPLEVLIWILHNHDFWFYICLESDS